jgi:hypothetical protein
VSPANLVESDEVEEANLSSDRLVVGNGLKRELEAGSYEPEIWLELLREFVLLFLKIVVWLMELGSRSGLFVQAARN